MQIRPTSASEAPQSPPKTPDDPLTRLARDVVESGARLEVPHKVAFFFTRYREAEPEEAVQHLDQPLRARLPGLDQPVSVQGEEDLRELAVFQKVRPASELAQPERAEALRQLSEQGWRFAGQDGEFGAYGAYNGLGQGVTAFKDERSVRLENDQKLEEMVRFYDSQHPDVAASLEEKGYRWFDSNGNVGSAFELGNDARIGKNGQAWFVAGDPSSLPTRAETFSRRLAEVPDLTAALKLHQLVESGQLTPEAAAGLLQEKSPQHGSLAAAVARELASGSTADFCAAGLQICAYRDKEAQTAWLDELAKRPDTAEVGRLTSDLIRQLKSDNACYYLWNTALEAPGVGAAEFGSRLYQKLSTSEDAADRQAIGQALLAALPSSAGSEALRRWGSDPDQGARALLSSKTTGNLRQLALAATPWNDKTAQRCQLEELAADPKTAAVGTIGMAAFDGLKTDNARYYLWQAALNQADQSAARFAKSLYAELSSSENAADRKTIAEAVLAGLAADPSTTAAAERVRSWGTDPDLAARAVAAQPSDDWTALALSATAWNDRQTQLRQLEELASDSSTATVGKVALQAFPQLTSDNARYYLWHTALGQAHQDVRGFAKSLYAEFSTSENAADRKLIGTTVLEAMKSDPAAQAVQQWQSDPDTAARAVAQKAGGSLRELALAATTWNDQAAQKRQLEQLAADPKTAPAARVGLAAFDQLKTENARYYLWHAVLQHGDKKLPDFAQGLYADYPTSENPADQKVIGQAVIAAMAADPATARAAAAVQRWQSDPSTAARALAQKAEANPRELALTATAWNDRASQKLQLEELAADPSTAAVGTLSTRVFDQLSTENSRYYLWNAAMTHGQKSLASFAKSLYDSYSTSENAADQKCVGQALIEAMAADPATAPAAQAVVRWQSDPNTGARALAANQGSDLHALARQATTWNDREVQRRQLEELSADPRSRAVGTVALEIFDQLKTENSRYYVWNSALEKADSKLPDFGKSLYQSLSTSENAADRQVIGQKLLEAMAADAATARAARKVLSWQPDPDTAARGLCAHSGANDRELALQVTAWNDARAQRQQLDELAGDPTTMAVGRLACAMFQRVKTDNGRYYVWQAALQNAQKSPADLVSAVVSSGEESGLVIAAYIDHSARDASLKELAGLARQVIPKTGYSAAAVNGLFGALERHPATPPSLASQMAQQRAQPDAQQIERLLGELDRLARAEDEVRSLARDMKEPSQGISVEKDRVVVGGVVLRKDS